MMPKLLYQALIFICLLIGLFACVKTQKPPTVAQELAGIWKLNKFGTDDNGNGVITLSAVATGYDDELVFNNNGTGKETTVENNGPMVSFNFTWSVSASDSLYRVGTGHEDITYFINSITGNTMYLVENTTSGLVGLYFVKK